MQPLAGLRILDLTRALAGHGAGVDNVAFSPDGRYLFTDSEDGTARVWDIGPEGSRELLTLARVRLTRSLTTDECRQYLHLDRCPDEQ